MSYKTDLQGNNTELQEILDAVNALPEDMELPTQEKTVEITENGAVEVLPDDGYTLSKVTANVNVPVPDGYIVPSGTKEIASNGEHDVAGYEKAAVNVPIPDGYIVPSGTQQITENGEYDVTEKAAVTVAVPERDVVLQNIEVTENGTYSAEEGYDGLGQVTVNVEASGGDGWYDTFWDAYQKNGEQIAYQYGFSENRWNINNFYPKYDIRPVGGTAGMFNYFNTNYEAFDLAQRLEECGVVLDTSGITTWTNTFNYANVTRLPALDCTGLTSANGAIQRCGAVTIDKLIFKADGSQNINGFFTWNQKLANVVVEGCIGKSFTMQWNTALTVESLQSFVDALLDLTGGTAATWTLHAQVGAKLTDEQKAAIAAKNWTVAY